jgi:hypothetical protein
MGTFKKKVTGKKKGDEAMIPINQIKKKRKKRKKKLLKST